MIVWTINVIPYHSADNDNVAKMISYFNDNVAMVTLNFSSY